MDSVSLPKVVLPTTPEPKQYVRAVTPGLRKLLYVVFALVAVLGANSAYLSAITVLEAVTQRTYQNYFYQLMFLGHLVLGLLLVTPFVVFGVKHMLYAKDRRNRRAVKVSAMPRRLRIEMPGGVYHVTNRGVDRTDIVRDDTLRLANRCLSTPLGTDIVTSASSPPSALVERKAQQ